jgi:hypothetical protein
MPAFESMSTLKVVSFLKEESKGIKPVSFNDMVTGSPFMKIRVIHYER